MKNAILIMAVVVVAVTTGVWAEDPYEVEWITQLGTSGMDWGQSVAVNATGNVYISGQTEGDLGGSNAGLYDAFVSKFDPDGTLLWTTQIGTSGQDLSQAVAVDASGNVYVSGQTEGDLGGSNAGSLDAFLSKFNPEGSPLWTTQIGTSEWDASHSLALDATGNAYISGSTNGDLGGSNAGSRDAFVSKFDPDGTPLWTTQIGTDQWDYSSSIAVDASGNAYISGMSGGDIGGPSSGDRDAFVSKFNPDGAPLWTKQIGTSNRDNSHAVAVDDSGNVYISGETGGDLGGSNAGLSDAFLSKFNPEGSPLWTTQIGTSDRDDSYDIVVDAFGNVYMGGLTGGSLSGSNFGSLDAFLGKFDSNGTLLWTTQIGTSGPDASKSLALDTLGNVYISGETSGDLGGPNFGRQDAFLAKYDVPEPATLSMLAIGGLALVRWRKRGTCK